MRQQVINLLEFACCKGSECWGEYLLSNFGNLVPV